MSLDFWSGVVVFLIRHHHVTFKSSELERYLGTSPYVGLVCVRFIGCGWLDTDRRSIGR